mmetsp:Transcript_93885/g.242567  ORF Transcript_93885/g.242567 Transcript_93885/m.242567 type:complete len:234 (-) Transcript_93885:67-768(-)|eukprot:CAMPEP_0195071452 /NCGR_PEP_ID=MMETSP0448-20130528/15267_1 /TAXON_ID=66468 /ORGANISM="Heterocapsa triquestra, Strain CCMP 448" /LENGTH=233 /DNA_ID=CAMNT_0040103311 /DNA_START=42 /DNA_END=743 /DNA_ORIENTATION=+
MNNTYLSFNDQHGMKGKLPCGPDREDDASAQALMEPMPLRSEWCFWELAVPQPGGSYGDATREVQNFSTAQEFWSIWNGVPQPSELLEARRIMRHQSNGPPLPIDAIMLFKKGVRPEWEDPKNATGGHFQVQLKPMAGGAQIDEYWNNVVLAMIGGTLEPYDMITGARLVDKISGGKAAGFIRIELWFSKYEDSTAVTALKKSMEKTMATRLDGSTHQGVKTELKGHRDAGKH